MNITEQLAAFTSGLQPGDLSAELAERARFLLLDLVGNAVRARHDSREHAFPPGCRASDGAGLG